MKNTKKAAELEALHEEESRWTPIENFYPKFGIIWFIIVFTSLAIYRIKYGAISKNSLSTWMGAACVPVFIVGFMARKAQDKRLKNERKLDIKKR